MSKTLTLTLHLWWLWVYLAIGAALYPWFCWRAYRAVANFRRLYTFKRFLLGTRWYHIPATVGLWPVALWEEIR